MRLLLLAVATLAIVQPSSTSQTRLHSDTPSIYREVIGDISRSRIDTIGFILECVEKAAPCASGTSREDPAQVHRLLQDFDVGGFPARRVKTLGELFSCMPHSPPKCVTRESGTLVRIGAVEYLDPAGPSDFRRASLRVTIKNISIGQTVAHAADVTYIFRETSAVTSDRDQAVFRSVSNPPSHSRRRWVIEDRIRGPQS